MNGNIIDETKGRSNWAFYLALTLLGPFLFLSILFSIFAPLPLLYLHRGIPERRKALYWALLASFIGIILCFLVKGLLGAAGFFFISVLPALLIGEILELTKSPEQSVIGSMAGMIAAALLAGFVFSQVKGMPLLPYAKASLTSTVTQFTKRLIENQEKLNSGVNADDLKEIQNNPSLIVNDFPGIALSTLLILCVIPMVAMIRWNPKGFNRRHGIPRDFIRRWHTSEWLIWPTLLCGAFLVFEVKYVSDVANNLLKPLLVIYFFHGLSILAFFLDSLRWRGLIRAIVYALGILFLTPMLVSFGFFDLWFNFRGRMKENKQE